MQAASDGRKTLLKQQWHSLFTTCLTVLPRRFWGFDMWTAITQDDDLSACYFGVPMLPSGEEMPANAFASGGHLSIELLALPVVRQGVVRPISMAMDFIPVLTKKAADFFSLRLGTEAQFIPCNNVDGHDLWVANIFTRLDCLNRDKSRAEYYPENYPIEHLANCVKSAFELSLNSDKVQGRDLFRIKGDPLTLVASDAFVEDLFENSLTGVKKSTFPRYITE